MADWSQTWTYVDGEWLEGNPPILGPRSHSMWQASTVYDGGRAFEGVTPDLDRHCARLNDSALALGLAPTKKASEILELMQDGLTRFDKNAELYLRPMYWAEGELGHMAVQPLPESTRFCLSIYEWPLPKPTGLSVCLSSFRRPGPEQAPASAKAACLYPNQARAMKEANGRGFDNAVVLDPVGNVAELATANLFMVKDGVVHTPAANGTFLNGITRQRMIGLLTSAGLDVHERMITTAELLDADELFSTGNYGAVLPVNRIEEHQLKTGPVYRRARDLYWEWAHS